jgi:hypothetical protein
VAVGSGRRSREQRLARLEAWRVDHCTVQLAPCVPDAGRAAGLTPPDRNLSIYRFDFDRDPARMDAHAWIFNTGDDVQLAAD